MKDAKLEDFIKYVKEIYDIDLTQVPSDEPDTFDTFFKSSDLIEEVNQEKEN